MDEVWDAVSRYVYSALQGGSIMKGWISRISTTLQKMHILANQP